MARPEECRSLKSGNHSPLWRAETTPRFRYTVLPGRGTQVGRERSAKPSFVGSIPTRASIKFPLFHHFRFELERLLRNTKTMKLLYCKACKSLFKLTRKKMRSCECRKVRGRYRKDGKSAEVSQNADTISVVIANRSLRDAVKRMQWWKEHRPESAREDYKSISGLVAWVRPNSGPGNPHSHKLKSELKNKAGKGNG
jgi:hypothetical protein